MITLQLTAEQFAYLVRAVDRDYDDHQHMLECGVNEDFIRRERNAGEQVSSVLDRVSQTQVIPF